MYFINGPLGDVGDMPGDRKGGRRTMPIVIGVRKTFIVIILSIVSIAAILVINYIFFGLHVVGTMLGLAICVSLILRIKNLSKQSEIKKKINQTRTAIRISVFAIQISTFIGMALNTLHVM
jgi:4-hydroxybenzoate polyprenyltransferase